MSRLETRWGTTEVARKFRQDETSCAEPPASEDSETLAIRIVRVHSVDDIAAGERIEMLQRTKRLLCGSLAVLPLMLEPVAHAQYNHGHGNFYNGARNGGRGGSYDRSGYHDGGYNNDGRYQGHGVGTGRGALIGGGVGAAAGAIFGGGLKGALIGGGAGAGIGAIAGHEHQQTMKRHYYDGGGYR